MRPVAAQNGKVAQCRLWRMQQAAADDVSGRVALLCRL